MQKKNDIPGLADIVRNANGKVEIDWKKFIYLQDLAINQKSETGRKANERLKFCVNNLVGRFKVIDESPKGNYVIDYFYSQFGGKAARRRETLIINDKNYEFVREEDAIGWARARYGERGRIIPIRTRKVNL